MAKNRGLGSGQRLLSLLLTALLVVTSLPFDAMAVASPAAAPPTILPTPNPVLVEPAMPEEPPMPETDPEGKVGIMWLDTAMDIAGFAMSYAEYNQNPTFWNAFQLVFDGAAVVVPGLPAVGALRGTARAVKAYLQRSAMLKRAGELGGVMSYWKLKLKWMPSGWTRHHIIEGRFADRFGGSYWTMKAIPIQTGSHQLITNKMRNKIAYRRGGNYGDLEVREILQHHIDAYDELFAETGDVYWEYLKDWTTEVLSRVPSHIQ